MCGGRHRSEKDDKRLLNRALRRVSRTLLVKADAEELEDAVVFPVQDEVMDQWSMNKDGKAWLPHGWAYGFGSRAKDMRK